MDGETTYKGNRLQVQGMWQAANRAVHQWVNDKGMISENLMEVATLKDIENAMDDCMLMWAYKMEAWKAEQIVLGNIKRLKSLMLSGIIYRNVTMGPIKHKGMEL